MNWPSDRVAKGGIFNPPKVNYSPETKKLLKDLMEESKLSMWQRQKINYSLRTGDPLPPLDIRKSKPRNTPPDIIIREKVPSRRKLSSIIESGAYDVEKLLPSRKGIDREYAIKYLQDHMAYGKELNDVPKKKPEVKQKNRYDELKEEIQERINFLDDMTKLGEGHKYKILMEQQIAVRIKEMEKLKLGEPGNSKQT